MRFGFACWISETRALRPIQTLAQGLYLRRFVGAIVHAPTTMTLVQDMEWRTQWKMYKLWNKNARNIVQQKDIISAFCERVMKQEALRVLTGWRSLVDSGTAFRTSISSAANMLLVRLAHQTRVVFMHWIMYWRDQGCRFLWAEFFLQKWTDQTRSSRSLKVFSAWKVTISRNKHRSSLSNRMMGRKHRSIRFTVFWTWKDKARTIRRILNAIQRKQMQSRLMGYVNLLNYAGRKRRNRAVVQKIGLMKKSFAFGGWTKILFESLMFRRIQTRLVMQRVAWRQTRKAAAIWIWQVQSAITRRSRLNWALRKLRTRNLRDFVTVWMDKALISNAVCSLQSRINLKNKFYIQEAAFCDFHAFCVQRRRLRIFCKHVKAVKRIHAIKAWKWQVQEIWRLAHAAAKVYYYGVALIYRRFFENWASAVFSTSEGGPEEDFVAVALAFDEDFDGTIQDATSRKRFEAKVAALVANTIKIPESKIKILCHQRGSVITEVLLQSDPEANRSAHWFAIKLKRSIMERVNELAGKITESPKTRSPAPDPPTSPPASPTKNVLLKVKGAAVHGRVPNAVYQALLDSVKSLRAVEDDMRRNKRLKVALYRTKSRSLLDCYHFWSVPISHCSFDTFCVSFDII